MDSKGRAAADVALACVVAAFLVAGAAFTASAVLGPRPTLEFTVSAVSNRGGSGGSSTGAASAVPRPGHAADSSASSSTASSGSQPSRSASTTPRSRSVSRAATSPSNDGGQVQAGGDIQAGDGAGDHDGN